MGLNLVKPMGWGAILFFTVGCGLCCGASARVGAEKGGDARAHNLPERRE